MSSLLWLSKACAHVLKYFMLIIDFKSSISQGLPLSELRLERASALPGSSALDPVLSLQPVQGKVAAKRDLTETMGCTYPLRNMTKVAGVKKSIFPWFLLGGSEAV